MFNREAVLDILSDMHKDAFGFRGGKDWNSYSDEELQNEIDYMQRVILDNIESEQQGQIRALTEWNVRITNLMHDHSISRETAIRWDMQGMDADTQEPDFYCYLNNIPYGTLGKVITNA